MTRQRLLDAIDRLRPWKRGDTRAPHKPLTLLWALGRVRQGKPRLASYAQDAHETIASLLREFGPPRKVAHPENPFWHLQSEGEGLWAVTADEPLRLPPRRSPTRRDLETHGVRAGLSKPLHDCLRRDPELLREAADRILFEHFPESLHDAIRDQVGLPRDAMTRGATGAGGGYGAAVRRGIPTSGMPCCGLTSAGAQSASLTWRSRATCSAWRRRTSGGTHTMVQTSCLTALHCAYSTTGRSTAA